MKVPEHARKRKKLSPPDDSSSEDQGNGYTSDSLPDNEYLRRASRWNLEQKYENLPRRLTKREKQSFRLPIKTAEGRIEQIEDPVELEEDGSDSWLGLDGEEENEDEAVAAPELPRKSSQEEIAEAQAELPRLASLISEDPEENIGAFKSLAQLSQSPNYVVKQLALATQMTVFKDVIPGYRIRLLDDKEITEKVTKEVKKQRAFEQTLVRSYKTYIETLVKCARMAGKNNSAERAAVANIAISCACELVLAAPHFNFRGDLIKILVHRLTGRQADPQFTKCRHTIEQLFQNDGDGNASLDAVTQITRMIKMRDCEVDKSVLNTFLHLRLLTEFSSKASKDSVDKTDESTGRGKKPKQKREFRTKRQRKAMKEMKAVEKDFREADAIATHEERDKLQGEMLKLVFGTCFRILKAKSPQLIGGVLEILAEFAHLVNQDFFGDLLEVFRELAQKAASFLDPAFSTNHSTNDDVSDEESSSNLPMDPTRTTLLCTTTAFSLLSAQDASRLSLDLSSFASLLYTLLLPTLTLHPDLEFSHKTIRLDDPHSSTIFKPASSSPADSSSPRINVSTLSTLLLRALTAVLSPRSTSATRLASFTHRLMSASLHTPEKTSRAILALLAETGRSQGRKVEALWRSEERRGDGEFDPLGDIETCKPFSNNVWEGELLRYHFSEGVRKGCGELEKIIKDLG